MDTVDTRVEKLTLPLFTAAEKFRLSIYLEHLEEASFLYDQRVTQLLDDPELTWLDLDDFEERMEAHLDALVLGDNLALAVCAQQAEVGDFGELHAAVCVFCRQQDEERFDTVLEQLPVDDEERVQAVADALCYEAPPAWEDKIASLFDEETPTLQAVAARVLGFRRWTTRKERLTELLSSPDASVARASAWALGRLRTQSAMQPLFRSLQHDNPSVRAEVALALLRMGEPNAVQYCTDRASTEPWALIPLGLCGGRSHVRLLLNLASADNAHPNALLALGLLGDPSAVELLLYQLPDEALAEAAATALHLITGANLYEEVFVPEEIDEDELFDDELEKLRRGEPLYEPGEAPGTELTRLAQDPEVWRSWWTEHASHVQLGVRYRNGKPYTPACLLENLTGERNPRQVRQLAYEELVIRYSIEVQFGTEMPVAQQKQALAQLAARAGAEGGVYKEGQWYFAERVYSQ